MARATGSIGAIPESARHWHEPVKLLRQQTKEERAREREAVRVATAVVKKLKAADAKQCKMGCPNPNSYYMTIKDMLISSASRIDANFPINAVTMTHAVLEVQIESINKELSTPQLDEPTKGVLIAVRSVFMSKLRWVSTKPIAYTPSISRFQQGKDFVMLWSEIMTCMEGLDEESPKQKIAYLQRTMEGNTDFEELAAQFIGKKAEAEGRTKAKSEIPRALDPREHPLMFH